MKDFLSINDCSVEELQGLLDDGTPFAGSDTVQVKP